MAKSDSRTVVLIVGDHPSAHLAGALLRHRSRSTRVVHAPVPGEVHLDRLVAINPAFFDLHKIVSPLRRKLDMMPIYGIRFLADQPGTSGQWSSRTIAGYVAQFAPLHHEMIRISRDCGVEYLPAQSLEIVRLDEHGLEVQINGKNLRARLMLLAGHLPVHQKKLLGLPHTWERGVLHRYTFVKLPGGTQTPAKSRRCMIAMSLDLRGTLWWAWLLRGTNCRQLAVAQPAASIAAASPQSLLRHWAEVLCAHKELDASADGIRFDQAESIELPLAGALSQEGVANRTLLLGPAGGFYTACAEEIYPACWSAVYAADTAHKAVQQPHVQDALHGHRQKWGATLGDFLRGPQQNLRFLLPLVYRNPMMTARLAEAILFGKSVVR